ncbi:hypothetical protein RUND412_007140 [Rhizina undulata]
MKFGGYSSKSAHGGKKTGLGVVSLLLLVPTAFSRTIPVARDEKIIKARCDGHSSEVAAQSSVNGLYETAQTLVSGTYQAVQTSTSGTYDTIQVSASGLYDIAATAVSGAYGSVETSATGTYEAVQVSASGTYETAQASASGTYETSATSQFWLEAIDHRGTAPFNSNVSTYKVFRNVKDYGAKGDGSTDDTVAINAAIQDGGRCGNGCDSSTIVPALVYFPAGTYVVSSPIVAMYYSQLVGDPLNLPVIKGSASFSGMALIDSDPYNTDGSNWYTNQNNFFRTVRNFVIDTTAMPLEAGTGIHWQVAQASTLMNIRFEMSQAAGNKHQGIFMDNGSGGHMSDLTFIGGRYGAFLGNQQFLTRNLTFQNCDTAIYMNWNWQWTFKSVEVDSCRIGVDVTAGGATAGGVGSVILLDSEIKNTPIGVLTVKSASSQPVTAASLILDNVVLSNVSQAVANPSGDTILAGGTTTIDLWGQGHTYSSSNTVDTAVQGNLVRAFAKPTALLDTSNPSKIFERSRPQYEDLTVSSFVSVKANGAMGDGSTDDTAAIQAIFNTYGGTDKIIYFDHGVYVVTSTVVVPKNTRIVGEVWAVIMASGSSAFKDVNNPQPVFQIGQAGDVGYVEMSELIFQTKGPQPGAILLQWNVHDPSGQQGANAMWEVHFRVGGSAGTDLEAAQCAKNPNTTITTPDANCFGAFMHLHITKTASLYLENIWAWTSDHSMDGPDFGQLTIYNGRGIYSESTDGPVWMYGTAAEHNVLYQYQLHSTKNLFMAMIQTETPYFQSNPVASLPFPINSSYNDPSFANCTTATCNKSWALRIVDSSDILVYGAGLYSFFENYAQDCIPGQTCQDAILSIEGSSDVTLLNLNTVASASMVNVDGTSLVSAAGNENSFARTIARFEL